MKESNTVTLLNYHSKYSILRKISAGGMGTVYLAEQLGASGFSKTVAIKVINRERTSEPETLRLFMDEAKLVADLIHENILQVYNLCSMNNLYFIVMEYVHGKNLHQFLERNKKNSRLATPDMSAFIISRVCRALEYAHNKKGRNGHHLGIVHRDVTPANVMIDYGGVVKLSDFGIAKALTMNIPDEKRVMMGKLSYMSPEQAKCLGTDRRSDIFSLGLIMYELLTGKKVYKFSSRKDLIDAMDNYRIKSLRKVNPSIPERLEEICMKALEKQPKDRYQRADDIKHDLEVYMYSKGYGPTNEKLASYVAKMFPEEDRVKIK